MLSRPQPRPAALRRSTARRVVVGSQLAEARDASRADRCLRRRRCGVVAPPAECAVQLDGLGAERLRVEDLQRRCQAVQVGLAVDTRGELGYAELVVVGGGGKAGERAVVLAAMDGRGALGRRWTAGNTERAQRPKCLHLRLQGVGAALSTGGRWRVLYI